MSDDLPQLEPIGHVESPLVDTSTAPKQGEEGAPDAWLVFDERFGAGLDGLSPGSEVVVLTWLHRGRRDVLRVHPRGDPDRPQRGVFTTRSPSRPNPIGLHRVEVVSVDGLKVRVRNLEAVDGTPVIDVKSVQPGRYDD
ncbi:MAG: tRNA (N6-threonylcarbamoyladenosine(37)-N6)-methyltransferase TrmO [Nitriliruptoraceae bacterium]